MTTGSPWSTGRSRRPAPATARPGSGAETTGAQTSIAGSSRGAPGAARIPNGDSRSYRPWSWVMYAPLRSTTRTGSVVAHGAVSSSTTTSG